ncbi:MAG: hypothetical protein JWO46_1238, partial [Nocardioidaceae bacterium]|nr:hypothetical protein [Nocardioidaceae bacterium]
VVTTPLRTACDLGRLLWRFDAFAALDAFRRAGVPEAQLLSEVERFRGYRGVRQLRAFAPLSDPLAESPAESALRLAWYDAALPPPTLQHWVEDDDGVATYRLDLALPEIRYAAEYDGEDFHSSPRQRAHDHDRRDWLTGRGWHIDVFAKSDIYGIRADAEVRLRVGFHDARRGSAPWSLARRSTTSATSAAYGQPRLPPRRA